MSEGAKSRGIGADKRAVVSSKPKRAAKRQPVKDEAPATTKPTTIVVRRGALKRFDSMKKKTAGLPVDLVWDRRVGGERREESGNVEGDRRKTDRRQQPPFTWSLADFVVVVPPGTEPPAVEPVEKKTKKR
jgi:hypothetical protein